MKDQRRSTRFRQERNARRITLATVREATGISVGRLSMIERGLATPNLSERERISAVFGMPPDELFPSSGPDHPPHA